MNYFYDPKEQQRVLDARESFSGRLLSNPQFDEAMAITGIIEREILKSGSFKEKLGDYSYAFARTENFDALKAETIIRDLFKARTGRTMNEMREMLVEREDKLTDGQKRAALDYASGVGEMIEKGNKISFHRAFTHQAQALASELGITDVAAKRLMKEEFAAASGNDLYEHGKAVEERFYRPQIEAEKQKAETRGRSEEHSRGNRDSSDDRSESRRPAENQRGLSRDRQNSGGSTRSRVGPRP
jgi:hypothetical protein